MQYATILALVSMVVGAIAAPAATADVTTISKDIAEINSKLQVTQTAIRNIITGPVTIDQALKLHGASLALIAIAGTTTNHVKAIESPFSEQDGQIILTGFKGLGNLISSITLDIIAIKPSLQHIGVVNIVRQDLSDVKASVQKMDVELLAHTPNSQLSVAHALQAEYEQDFAKAELAYK